MASFGNPRLRPGLTASSSGRLFLTTIRSDLNQQGFALVKGPVLREKHCVRHGRRGSVSLNAVNKDWEKYPCLARYVCWLESLLQHALPEEALALKYFDLRFEPTGTAIRQVDRLHADGSYLRCVYTVCGPTTIYRGHGTEHSVPDGWTLLMTAQGRTRAKRVPSTLHRRPGAGPERVVIVCSFEPQAAEQPHGTAYREAGLDTKLRRGHNRDIRGSRFYRNR